MSKTLRLSTMALVGATATGVFAFTAPAIADDGTGIAYKRDDESGKVITTADHDDDDDNATSGSTNTGTNTNGGTNTGTSTNTGGNGTNTGTRTNGANTDHSRDRRVNDVTNDGPGKGNIDDSRGHTNDGTRHNTRG
jgi:hypothetical protein